MIYLKLLYTFFKIGLFGFGGGYAMISIIQREMENNSWLTKDQFSDVIALSQLSPGSLVINIATYIGLSLKGFLGLLFAVIGVSLPSYILVIILAKFFFKFKEKSSVVESVLNGIRPVTIGLIASAILFLLEMSVLDTHANSSEFIVNKWALLIFFISLILTGKFKVHPVIIVLGSGILGILLL